MSIQQTAQIFCVVFAASLTMVGVVEMVRGMQARDKEDLPDGYRHMRRAAMALAAGGIWFGAATTFASS